MKLFLVLALVAIAVARKHFDGYKVVKVMPKDKEQSDYLHYLHHNDVEIDFWEEVPRQGPVTIMVDMIKYATLTTEFLRRDIRYEVIKDNVEEQVEEELSRIMQKKAFDLDDFNTLADIESELTQWASQCSGGLSCQRYSIGTSYEGRNIYAFSMSTGSGRQAIWFDATIHAREWLAPATLLKLMDYFIQGYGSDLEATNVLNTYDLYFLPVNNPDGYVYTYTNDRYWRKNRSPNAGTSCIGTDLNRNFAWNWGMEGVSHNPCASTYCGSGENSEAEVQAVVNEVTRISSSTTIPALITIHSYGRMWLHPWGNTILHGGGLCERTPDHDDLYGMSVLAATAVEATYNTRWIRGNGCEEIYATTGSTDDWAKGVPQIKYPFCLELRGNDFSVNRNQIEPSFQEIRNGLMMMFDNM